MDLIVDTRPSNPYLGLWTVHIPLGEPPPPVLHPEIWVGEGSMQLRRDLVFRSGDRELLAVEGIRNWYNVHGVGRIILKLTPPKGKWEVGMGLLQVWLIHVFEEDVRLVYIPSPPASTIPATRRARLSA